MKFQVGDKLIDPSDGEIIVITRIYCEEFGSQVYQFNSSTRGYDQENSCYLVDKLFRVATPLEQALY